MQRAFGTGEPVIQISSDGTVANLKTYVLSQIGGKPVYSSSTRAIENVPSDRFEIVLSDQFGKGLGDGEVANTSFISHLPKRLMAGAALPAALAAAGVTGQLRHSFEDQDANGRWYKYIYGPQTIIKIDIGVDPPVVRQVYTVAATSGFNSNDRIGRAVRDKNSSVNYWYFPVNNGDRVVRMASPVAVDDGTPTADTFTAFTTMVNGAAHARWLPGGTMVRFESFHSAGTFQNRSLISIKPAGLDFQTDANWGGPFYVGQQSTWGVGINNFGLTILFRKQEGWITALINADLTITFGDVLPDGQFFEQTTYGLESTHEGDSWHGYAFLPTPQGLWRTNIFGHRPVGPDEIRALSGDYSNAQLDGPANAPARFGYVRAVAPSHGWLYVLYSSGMILAARERGENIGDGAYEWFSVLDYAAQSAQANGIWRQRNGSAAPRLWFVGLTTAGNTYLYRIPLGNDLSVWRGSVTNGYAGTLISPGIWCGQPITFPSNVLLEEVRFAIQRGGANFSWSFKALRDGATSPDTVGSALTASGSIFWTPGTSDTCRTLIPIIECTYAGFADLPPEIVDARLFGDFLPDVSDPLMMVIDLRRTADRRTGTTPQSIRDELRALRYGGAKAWVDPRQTAGTVLVTAADDGAPKNIASLRVEDTITVRATLVEYA